MAFAFNINTYIHIYVYNYHYHYYYYNTIAEMIHNPNNIFYVTAYICTWLRISISALNIYERLKFNETWCFVERKFKQEDSMRKRITPCRQKAWTVPKCSQNQWNLPDLYTGTLNCQNCYGSLLWKNEGATIECTLS